MSVYYYHNSTRPSPGVNLTGNEAAADDSAARAVRVEHVDGACRLILDRPERGNAMGPDMVAAINADLTEALAHQAWLLVLQGAGRNFCTGFDLSGLDVMTDSVLLERFIRVELCCSTSTMPS